MPQQPLHPPSTAGSERPERTGRPSAPNDAAAAHLFEPPTPPSTWGTSSKAAQLRAAMAAAVALALALNLTLALTPTLGLALTLTLPLTLTLTRWRARIMRWRRP